MHKKTLQNLFSFRKREEILNEIQIKFKDNTIQSEIDELKQAYALIEKLQKTQSTSI